MSDQTTNGLPPGGEREARERIGALEAEDNKTYFSRELLVWYDRSKRDLPWRRHRDPYFIWVSEIMLQQTRVDTVIPYFNRFIERFPTIAALAEAPEEDVVKMWEGLGYYSRARNLQAAARQIVELHSGSMPSEREHVFALKGVGPYTAGAILSIAFNQPEPAVDGNVMRVLSRYFLIEDDIAKPKTRIAMEKMIPALIPEGRASDFNQALMELGALICTPKSPHCLICPVMEHCRGRIEGMERELPVKTKAKKPRPEQRLAVLLEGEGERAGRVLVRRRPKTGLLAGMWELPHIAAGSEDWGLDVAQLEELLEERGLMWSPMSPYMTAEHTFSHIHWTMRVLIAREQPDVLPQLAAESGVPYLTAVPEASDAPADGDSTAAGGAESGEWRWVSREGMQDIAFPNLFLNILNKYFDGESEEERR
ncbi:A/G-specific adenine glycosylase [Saccharibacillus sp. CPCC 101409]|uniref:A/G-specific adenine glycosylase n=1 Tax=Saccharibacillus sp. CPCC 101409 TaxID=3058041 RepID=UPI0026725B94|nr:A/G-specific adenine glycosylase [Saccharibacillus sp. CPCC 101409]MDO3412646.1 A/G-specific adenine glycosylase [Saccharibacillus sp. CPCC 101409]